MASSKKPSGSAQTVSVRAWVLRGDDLLVVRIHNTEGMGVVWKPVHLIVSD